MLKGSKHCWSQHGTTIFLFFREFEINWVGKSLPESHLKSSYCLLTRWLPMTSIPVAISRLSDNKFKRLYLKKKETFLRFFIELLKYAWNLESFEKKKSILAYYYRNYCIRKRCLLKPLKGLASADHSVINGLTGSKHSWSQEGTTIFNFFHESEINWVGKSLP